MKMLGLVGGTSWVSTMDYYRLVNEGVNARLGGTQFARCEIYSFNYADILKYTLVRDWDAVFAMVAPACDHLRSAGAEALVLCANTMHLLADRLGAHAGLPIVHIVDATAAAVRAAGLDTVALLGTRFTMEMDFFRDRLERHGVRALIPDDAERTFIHETIFGELGRGILRPATKTRYLEIIAALADRGAEGAILGCTEIPLIVKQEDTAVPVFDTTVLHAAAAVEFALG